MSLWSSITKIARKALPFILPGVGGVAVGVAANLIPSKSPTLPRSIAPPVGPGMANIPIPGQALERFLPGGQTGFASARKFKVGKLSGNPIPHGYSEKMSKQGVIYLSKHRRRRGISARDLQNYRRVHRLFKTYGKKYK